MDQEPAAALGVEMWLRWTQMFTSLLAAFFGHVSAAQQTFPKYTLCTRPWAGYWGPTEVKAQALALESSLQKNKQCGALDPLSITNPFVKLMKSYDLREMHPDCTCQSCTSGMHGALEQSPNN